MSDNIFINGDLNDIFTAVESEKIDLPKWLNIVDRNNDLTSDLELTQINNLNNLSETSVLKGNSETSVNNNQFVDNLSATSLDINDIFVTQQGGNVDKNLASPDDINNLVNMLTSEKANEDFDTITTVTNTAALEDQLKDLLGGKKLNQENQEGGSKKASKKSSKKASKKSSKKASKKSSKKSSKKASKSKGGKKASKKSSKKASKKASKKSKGGKKSSKKSSKKASKKSSKKASKKSKGGKKASKKSSKKASKKKSRKYKGEHPEEEKVEVEAEVVVEEEKEEPEKEEPKKEEPKKEEPKKEEPKKEKKSGGNPGFNAFQDLKKHVAEKLGIPAAVKAVKIAAAAKKEFSEGKELSAVEASQGSMKYFDDNIEKFKKMLSEM